MGQMLKKLSTNAPNSCPIPTSNRARPTSSRADTTSTRAAPPRPAHLIFPVFRNFIQTIFRFFPVLFKNDKTKKMFPKIPENPLIDILRYSIDAAVALGLRRLCYTFSERAEASVSESNSIRHTPADATLKTGAYCRHALAKTPRPQRFPQGESWTKGGFSLDRARPVSLFAKKRNGGRIPPSPPRGRKPFIPRPRRGTPI